MSEIKRVFYANSTYSLLEYLLQMPKQEKISISDLVQQTLFVVGSAIKNIRIPEENKIAYNEKEAKLEDIVRPIQKKLAHQTFQPTWYINARAIFASDFLHNNHMVNILSDGLSDRDTFPKLVLEPSIKKCYSTEKVMDTFQHEKLEIFDIHNLLIQTTKADKMAIANIFNATNDVLEKAASRPVLLATQPLSEDNMMSETDKIELYRRIVSVYGEDNVIVKPHPRDNTTWASIFPRTPVISKQLPMELLSDLTHLQRIATFFSTSAFGTLADSQVDFFAKDFALLKAYHPTVKFQNGYKSIAPSDIEENNKRKFQCNWLRIPDTNGRFYRVIAHQSNMRQPTSEAHTYA